MFVHIGRSHVGFFWEASIVQLEKQRQESEHLSVHHNWRDNKAVEYEGLKTYLAELKDDLDSAKETIMVAEALIKAKAKRRGL